MKLAILAITILIPFTLVAQNTPCPCCTPAHRQFDFWIGEWTVTRADGQLAGRNTISVVQDSCALQENWTSASGNFRGTSYNYFDPADSTWNQLWLDNQGGNLILKGRRSGNQMILSSNPVFDSSGNNLLHRITWTLNGDGSVRQLWETSTNAGAWTIVFDGLYEKGE